MSPWGESSALTPAGPQAGHIAGVWWVFFAVTAVVYVAVLVALGLALTRRAPVVDQQRRTRVVGAAVALTVLILVGLLVKSVAAGKALTAMTGTATVTVRVTARQWWWQLEYQAQPPSQMVTTANELHIPVGQPVLLLLESRDVIHSFWVPALHGKRDLIPGHPSATYLRADRPGVYRGQCAEFCGAQHGNMGLLVVAEPPPDFQAWLARTRQPAAPPVDPLARRGQDVFLSGPCVLCHAIAGTLAAASAGPDLTHLAARRTLAAGTLPNRRDTLKSWLKNAQDFKPGAHMPRIEFGPRDLDAMLAYLETLQ